MKSNAALYALIGIVVVIVLGVVVYFIASPKQEQQQPTIVIDGNGQQTYSYDNLPKWTQYTSWATDLGTNIWDSISPYIGRGRNAPASGGGGGNG